MPPPPGQSEVSVLFLCRIVSCLRCLSISSPSLFLSLTQDPTPWGITEWEWNSYCTVRHCAFTFSQLVEKGNEKLKTQLKHRQGVDTRIHVCAILAAATGLRDPILWKWVWLTILFHILQKSHKVTVLFAKDHGILPKS